MIKVIAADDEQYLQDALKSLVPWRDLGAELIKICTNGRELMEAVEEVHPDLVITDIRMPVMDGLEVCRRVYEKYPDTSVIVLSAFSDFSYAKTAMKYGATEYILKADVVEELPLAVERAIEIINKSREESEAIVYGEKDQNLFSLMQDYIGLHYREDMSLNEMADALHANPSYLSRLYKKKTGINLFDEITTRRIEKAKECLLSDMKINDIAEYLGYNDPGYFSRIFKKITGASPREYRQGRKQE